MMTFAEVRTRVQSLLARAPKWAVPVALGGVALLIVAIFFMLQGGGGTSGVMREIERAQAKEEVVNLEEPQTMPSGLILQFRRRGADQRLPRPSMDAQVLVHYEGSLAANGTVFDSSFQRGEPAQFGLREVVPGFAEAITHMRPGDEVMATFPPELGYGDRDTGLIPPNSALQFRIRLLAFQDGPDQPVVRAP